MLTASPAAHITKILPSRRNRSALPRRLKITGPGISGHAHVGYRCLKVVPTPANTITNHPRIDMVVKTPHDGHEKQQHEGQRRQHSPVLEGRISEQLLRELRQDERGAEKGNAEDGRLFFVTFLPPPLLMGGTGVKLVCRIRFHILKKARQGGDGWMRDSFPLPRISPFPCLSHADAHR
jgi:hypothetical protein